MWNTIKRIGLILMLSILAVQMAGCASSQTEAPPAPAEKISLKLSWSHNIQFLGFYVAQSRGYYTEEGLEVVISPVTKTTESDKLLSNVALGNIDFALNGQDVMTANINAEISIIAVIYQFSPTALFARADSGIIVLNDLAGHTIVAKSEAWRMLVIEMLQEVGLTADDVTFVPGGFDMAPFYEGEVDVWTGFLTNEVIQARQHGFDVITFPLYEYGVQEYHNMIYTSQALLNSNPDKAVRFLRASLRGWEWAVEHPEEAVGIMLEMFPEMASDRDFHLQAFRASIPLISYQDVPIGSLDCQRAGFKGDALSPKFCTDEILRKVWAGEP